MRALNLLLVSSGFVAIFLGIAVVSAFDAPTIEADLNVFSAQLGLPPCTTANGEYHIVQGLDIDEFSRTRIDASVGELAEERDAVKELGLI